MAHRSTRLIERAAVLQQAARAVRAEGGRLRRGCFTTRIAGASLSDTRADIMRERLLPRQPRVLIVDDDSGTRETLSDILAARGYDVAIADNATAGLANLQSSGADVSIVDIMLPDMTGLEVLDAMKGSSSAPEVIFITGHASLPTAIQAINGSAFAYLVKPFEMDHMLSVLKRAVERRRLTHMLRETTQTLEALVDASPLAIWMQDPRGAVQMWSPAAEAMFGWSRDEVIGRPLPIVAPDRQKEARALLARGLRGHALAGIETRRQHKSGAQIDVSISTAPLRDPAGATLGVAMIAADITERKRAEIARRESRQALESVLQSSPAAVIALDPEGNVTRWNRSAERMFGWTESEVLGRPLPSLPEDEQSTWSDVFAKRLAAGGQTDVEVRRTRKDGSIIHVSLSTAPLTDAEGRVTGMVGFLLDITERKILQEQLRQAQKLEAIGSLAGGIAHDFNNLLTVIGGRSHIAKTRLEDSHAAYHDLELIEQTTERAARLTQQLLAFSRKQVLEPRVLNLGEAIQGMERMLQRLIGEDIELVTEADPDLWLVKADPSQVEQVIMNLAVNARDAMRDGGQLTIEVRNVELDESYARSHASVEPGLYVMLAVTDNGHGMDGETQAKIFEPFFTTKGPGRGTGLGLSTVYGIVKQSGGHIWLYSEVGRGTSFKIYLPRVEGEVPTAAPLTPRSTRGRETVLLVEDDEQVRALARETLQLGGYRVLEAASPDAALTLARLHTGAVDLLLSDVVMPGMNGRALADRVLVLRPGLKVLFMSGYPSSAIVHHGVLEPGAWFLQKPFTPGSLARKVREVLDARV